MKIKIKTRFIAIKTPPVQSSWKRERNVRVGDIIEKVTNSGLYTNLTLQMEHLLLGKTLPSYTYDIRPDHLILMKYYKRHRA
jgi:hypothetical protein